MVSLRPYSMSANAKLTRGSIPAHLVTQALPMMLGVAATMSIGLVDAYFIGQLGSAELAAIAYIFPITVVLTSLGVGLMVGINSVVARALGEGDTEKAHRRANLGIVLALASGAAIGLALFTFADPLFRLMQAPAHLLPLIREYVRPLGLGFMLMTTILGISGVLRGQGEARMTFYVSVSYAAANWVLDPLLITGAFGFEGFGIAGAAYASIIGWTIGVALGLSLIGKSLLPFRPRMIAQCRVKETAAAIVSVAGPAAFANAINPVGLSVLTTLISREGEAAVAGFGAAGRVQSFALVPLLALSGAIGAIVGQNWGASQPERSRQAMLLAGGFSMAYGLAIAVALAFGGGWFADFFTDDPQIMTQFARYLSIAAWGYAGFGVLIVANGALNAVDRAAFSLTQSALRVFLVMLPIAWFLRPAWGADAIYTAELAANLIGGCVAALVVWRVLRVGPASSSTEGD